MKKIENLKPQSTQREKGVVVFFKKLIVGPLEANCYLLADENTHEGMVIDPGGDGETILDIAKREGIVLRYIINTHGHADHIGAIGYLKEQVEEIKTGIHKDDAGMLTDADKNLSNFTGMTFTSPPADFFLKEGDEIKLGEINLKVIHTPGHTPGGISLIGEGIVFTGDTLFASSIGRIDLPGGSKDLIQNIKDKLMVLPEETVIYPGHGESSTIGREKSSNPFILGVVTI